MPNTSSGPRSRTSTDHFLVGPEMSDLGKDANQGKLPLTCDVLKYIFYSKSLPEFKSKPLHQIIFCPFKSCINVANCDENPNCKDSSECVVRKVKNEGNWVASGIPMIADLAILNKVKKLNEDHKALAKNKNKPNCNLVKRELFSEKLDELFDICVPDVENRLLVDRLRVEQAREEDLLFLEDQRDPDRRKMCVGKERDKEYDYAIHDKVLRETRNDRVKLRISENNNV